MAPDSDTPADETPDTSDGASPTTPLSDEDIRDALPEDLDAAGYVGPYLFPNNNKRRVPGALYLVIAALCILLYLVAGDGSNPLVNSGFLWAGIGLAAFGAYCFVAGWDLDVDERDALVAATKEVGFPVGHASAPASSRISNITSSVSWRSSMWSPSRPA